MSISKKKLFQIVEAFRQTKIAVLGDLILDRYLFGSVERISPEAPVPVIKVEREEFRPGGAANVAQNISSLQASSLLIGICGEDAFGKELERLTGGEKFFLRKKGQATILKTRIMASRQQLLRIDRDYQLTADQKDLLEIISALKKFQPDAIVISDYAKGFVTGDLMLALLNYCRENKIDLFVDPKAPNYPLYRGVSALTPNRKETKEMLAKYNDLEHALKKIIKKYQTKYAVITLGEEGICGKQIGHRSYLLPAFSREVFDVTGAGDTVIAVFALALTVSGSLREALFLANLAASLVVGKVGTAAIDYREYLKRIELLKKDEFKLKHL